LRERKPGPAAGGFHERDGELWCEGVPLAEIARQLGTPCFVYSEATIRRRYESFRSAFRDVPSRIFYSVKANHNLSLLRVFRDLGAGADVVSLGELDRVRRAGFTGSNIVFGGVGKRADEIEAALAERVLLINVESEAELRRLSELAAARGLRAAIALRVNPSIQAHTHDYTQTGHYRTKFGLAWEDAERLYAAAAQLPGIEPAGIAAHIGSQIHAPEPFLAMIERLRELARRLQRAAIPLRYLDIGGGFGVPHDGSPEIDLSVIAAAARAATAELGLTCLLEPGRWLVAPAGVLLARVLYVKTLGGRSYCVSDAGLNDFVRPSYYGAYHPIEAARPGPAAIVADVVGPVCEAGDFLGRECRLPRLSEGDLLVLRFAGAYGSVMSSNYNARPRAAEVLVSGDSFRVVRRRETLADLVAPEEPGAERGQS
jgi:diaminopimelate decarboxylase